MFIRPVESVRLSSAKGVGVGVGVAVGLGVGFGVGSVTGVDVAEDAPVVVAVGFMVVVGWAAACWLRIDLTIAPPVVGEKFGAPVVNRKIPISLHQWMM